MEPEMLTGAMAAKLFPLLFNMMGPIGVIPVFAALTVQMDDITCKAVARRAALLASCALILAVFLGAIMLEAWSISNGALILAAGLIVTLSALLPLLPLQLGAGSPNGGAEANSPEKIAMTPLAFPAIVTPRAVGLLIIFVAFFSTMSGKLAVLSVALIMLLLDYVGMRHARWFMLKIGMTPLLVLGAVFGVLQVALGVQMMADGWHYLSMP